MTMRTVVREGHIAMVMQAINPATEEVLQTYQEHTKEQVDSAIQQVYDRQKHPFTTPPTRSKDDPMLTFYRDTFASQAANDQPIFDMKKAGTALDQLLDCPIDQRIAVEGGLQRVASVIVMQELFSMA